MPHIFRIANLESCAPESIPVPPDNVSVRVDWDRGHECVATVEALTLKDLWAYVYPTWIDGSRWEEVLRPSEITLHYGNAEDVTAFGGVVRHYGVNAEFVDDLAMISDFDGIYTGDDGHLIMSSGSGVTGYGPTRETVTRTPQ